MRPSARDIAVIAVTVALLIGGQALSIPLWAMALLAAAGAAFFAICLKYGDRWEQALFEKLKK